jgi:hypothetical protein
MSAQNTDYAVRMPSLMLLTAVVVLGTLDAFSGLFSVFMCPGGNCTTNKIPAPMYQWTSIYA